MLRFLVYTTTNSFYNAVMLTPVQKYSIGRKA